MGGIFVFRVGPHSLPQSCANCSVFAVFFPFFEGNYGSMVFMLDSTFFDCMVLHCILCTLRKDWCNVFTNGPQYVKPPFDFVACMAVQPVL